MIITLWYFSDATLTAFTIFTLTVAMVLLEISIFGYIFRRIGL
jgi:hypothetical protein